MQITTHGHGVEVTFQTRSGRGGLPSFRILWPKPLFSIYGDSPHVDVERRRRHFRESQEAWMLEQIGIPEASGFAVFGILMFVALLWCVYLFEGIEPTWEAMLLLGLCLSPSVAPLSWLLSKTRIATTWRPATRAHTLSLDSAGVRLDGERCGVWLANDRLVTEDGVLYQIVEAPEDLRKLRDLIASAASLRARVGDAGEVPSDLLSMRGAARRNSEASEH